MAITSIPAWQLKTPQKQKIYWVINPDSTDQNEVHELKNCFWTPNPYASYTEYTVPENIWGNYILIFDLKASTIDGEHMQLKNKPVKFTMPKNNDSVADSPHLIYYPNMNQIGNVLFQNVSYRLKGTTKNITEYWPVTKVAICDLNDYEFINFSDEYYIKDPDIVDAYKEVDAAFFTERNSRPIPPSNNKPWLYELQFSIGQTIIVNKQRYTIRLIDYPTSPDVEDDTPYGFSHVEISLI